MSLMVQALAKVRLLLFVLLLASSAHVLGQTMNPAVIRTTEQLTLINRAEVQFQQMSTPVGNEALTVSLVEADRPMSVGTRLSSTELGNASSISSSIYLNLTAFDGLTNNTQIRFVLRPRDTENQVLLESGVVATTWFDAAAINEGGVSMSETEGIVNTVSFGSSTEIGGETWVFMLATFDNLPDAADRMDVLLQIRNAAEGEEVQLAGWTIIPR